MGGSSSTLKLWDAMGNSSKANGESICAKFPLCKIIIHSDQDDMPASFNIQSVNDYIDTVMEARQFQIGKPYQDQLKVLTALIDSTPPSKIDGGIMHFSMSAIIEHINKREGGTFKDKLDSIYDETLNPTDQKKLGKP